MAELIGGGIIGLFLGYHIGIWRAFIRLSNAERRARLRNIKWVFRNRDGE